MPDGVTTMGLQAELKKYYESKVPVDLPQESDYVRCQIPGVLEAICVSIKSTEGSNIQFCQNYLYDYVCVPLFHPLWPEWSTKTKDKLVQQIVAMDIERRFQNELNQNTFDPNYKLVSGLQLTSDEKCMQNFVKFMCRYNFNVCDPETGEVYPPCMSDCDKAFGTCGVDSSKCSDPL